MSLRRTERLSRIVALFREKNLWTATDLSKAVSVTEATIYRDIATLQKSSVNIKGVRGKGYFVEGPVVLVQPPQEVSTLPYHDHQLGKVRRALRRVKRRMLGKRDQDGQLRKLQ